MLRAPRTASSIIALRTATTQVHQPLIITQASSFHRVTDFTHEQLTKIFEKKMHPSFKQPGKVLPINIKKGLQHPTIIPDSELPEWVFEASKPERSLEDLETQLAKKGLKSLTAYEQKRIRKLRRRNRIKNNNYEREIGLVLSK